MKNLLGFEDYNEFINIYNSGNEEEIKSIEKKLVEKMLTTEMENLDLTCLVIIWRVYLVQSIKKYSTITEVVYSSDIEKIDEEIYSANIEKFVKEAVEREILPSDELDKYMKGLYNHIKLAEQQKKYIEQNIESLKLNISEAEKHVDDLKDTKGKIYSEFVAILGIFTSIVFAVLGGFNQLSTLAESLPNTPIPKLLIFISLLMLGINFLVFMSFNAISKLTSLPLSSCRCGKEDCDCKFRRKHPSVFYSSLFFMYMTLVGFALRLYKVKDFTIVDMYNDINFDILPLVLLITPVLMLFIGFLIHIFKYLYKKYKSCKKNKQNTLTNKEEVT